MKNNNLSTNQNTSSITQQIIDFLLKKKADPLVVSSIGWNPHRCYSPEMLTILHCAVAENNIFAANQILNSEYITTEKKLFMLIPDENNNFSKKYVCLLHYLYFI
jgi:hypothetical protein